MWRELVVVVSGESQERQVEASLADIGAVTTVRERHYHLANVAGDYELEVAFDALADEYSDAERQVMARYCAGSEDDSRALHGSRAALGVVRCSSGRRMGGRRGAG